MFRSSSEVNLEAQWAVNQFLAKELGIKLENNAWLLFEREGDLDLGTSATPAFSGPNTVGEVNESTPFVFLHPLTMNLYCVRGFGCKMELHHLNWRYAEPIERDKEFVAKNPGMVTKPRPGWTVTLSTAWTEGDKLVVFLDWTFGNRELHYDLKRLRCLGAKY